MVLRPLQIEFFRNLLGVSIFPEHGADCETLIKNADAAMYSAKETAVITFSSLPRT